MKQFIFDLIKISLFFAALFTLFWLIEGITPQDIETIEEEVNLGWR